MKISVVSYLNSAPLVHGIMTSKALESWTVSLDVPSAGARRLADGEVDLALVPVGAFPEIGRVNWVGRYCIGVEGPVRTVCLFSMVPIQEIREVWLDPHSRTSVQLIKILAEQFWKTEWSYHPAEDGFEKHAIKGHSAGVCIGDKVFEIENRYPYRYDLAEQWIAFTGLPFVFAAWASIDLPDPRLIEQLDVAQESGLKAIPGIARDWSSKVHLPELDIRDYLSRNISYGFTSEKKAGMERFLSIIRSRS